MGALNNCGGETVNDKPCEDAYKQGHIAGKQDKAKEIAEKLGLETT